MSKAFNGQPDSPAPCQDYSIQKSVYDTSTPSKSAPTKTTNYKPVDTNDHSDSSEFAKRQDSRQREFKGDHQPGNNPEKAE